MAVYDFFATVKWYADHLAPVWEALPSESRGSFLRPGAGRQSVELPLHFDRKLYRGNVAVVAANFDQKYYGRFYNGVVRFEHGAGFSYHGDGTNHPSYAGGTEATPNVKLLPATNRWVQAANARAFSDIASPIVGCPKLDRFLAVPKPRTDTVAISFHWDCHVAPEARSAFMSYRRVLPALNERFNLIGHAHPRAWTMLKNWYEARGIEPVHDFEEVVRRADVYVVDSSSTLYEFAALDRPVVSMNAPWYRKDVQHGLRFWDRADVGVQCDKADDLADAIELAMKDEPQQAALRREAIAEVYPFLGHSAARAVEEMKKVED